MATDGTEWGSLTIESLRLAADLYLQTAYDGVPVPEVVRRRLVWDESLPPADLLCARPFERIKSTTGEGPAVHALRLGNAGYPNMKLQIQVWPGPCGYLLSVNSHDQVAAQVVAPAELEAFRALQTANQRIKETIESAWDAQGLPTFLRYLRDYIEAHPGEGTPA